MKLINKITSDPSQNQTIVLDDGSRATISLYYRPLQYGWFIQSLIYGTQEYNEIRIVTSPNFLHQLKNNIPFGLSCYTTDNQEPKLINDFSSGYAKLYLLSAAETAQYARYLSGQN